MMTRLLAAWFAMLAIAFSAEKPNIVLIYADDLGYGDISCNGAEAIQTPNCDRLANEGLNLSAGYSTGSMCTPSRYSLLTGEYPFRKKGTGVLPGDARMIIAPGRATVQSVLKTAGYRTGVVGKWHLGLGDGKIDWNGSITPGPRETGFDESLIMAATGDRVPCVYLRNDKVVNLDPADPIEVSYDKPFPGEPDGVKNRADLKMDWSYGHNMAVVNGVGRIGYMRGGKSALWKDETMCDEFAREAVDFIGRIKGKPFFLYFATHDVHVPRVVNPRFAGKSGMGPRGDAILEFDWQVGQVLDALDKAGVAENTLVVLTSDNGPVLNDGYKDDAAEKLGNHKPAGPFRDGKGSNYEGGTRVPFLVRWPAKVKAGTKSAALISQVDLPATFAALAGTKFPQETAPDTRDLSRALTGEDPVGRDHLLQYSSRVSVRSGKWKYIPAGRNIYRQGKFTPAELFDLDADPGERKSVISEHPEIAEELAGKIPQAKPADLF